MLLEGCCAQGNEAGRSGFEGRRTGEISCTDYRLIGVNRGSEEGGREKTGN